MLQVRNGYIIPAACSLVFAVSVANSAELEQVTIEAQKLITPTKQSSETVYTGSEVTSKGIELQGTKASGSVFETIRTLPGISVESADDNGLNAEQNNMRVRGFYWLIFGYEY